METMAALIENMDTLTFVEIETHTIDGQEVHILLLTIEDTVLSLKITEPDLERLRDMTGGILEDQEDQAAMARQDKIMHERLARFIRGSEAGCYS